MAACSVSARLCMGERERESEPEREGKGEGGASWRPRASLGGHLGGLGASRRWHRRAPGSSTQLLHKEDKPTFAKIPKAFGVFWEF
jgi:hypothetical protein